MKHNYKKTLSTLKTGSLALVFSLFVVGLALGGTTATWNDTAAVSGNSVATGFWQEENNPAPVKVGDVVINEILWSGSGANSWDQWIELRNTTDEDIDIGKWIITNAKSGGNPYMIPANKTLPAGGFFLIANYPQQSNNSALSEIVTVNQVGNINFSNDHQNNGQVILKNTDEVIIDVTPEPQSSSWPEGKNESGENEKRWSMQRGETPGDGADPDNWYTCDRDILEEDGTLSTMESYWKEDHQETSCGTPGHENLSSNDPTKTHSETETSPNEETDALEEDDDKAKDQPENTEEKDEEDMSPEESNEPSHSDKEEKGTEEKKDAEKEDQKTEEQEDGDKDNKEDGPEDKKEDTDPENDEDTNKGPDMTKEEQEEGDKKEKQPEKEEKESSEDKNEPENGTDDTETSSGTNEKTESDDDTTQTADKTSDKDDSDDSLDD